jgi:Mg/Co/Ni transporter MgtE
MKLKRASLEEIFLELTETEKAEAVENAASSEEAETLGTSEMEEATDTEKELQNEDMGE